MAVIIDKNTLLWRTVAVVAGASIGIYMLETMGSTPLIDISFGDAFYFLAFMVALIPMMWGMMFTPEFKPKQLRNRILSAAPALLGITIAGSYIVLVAGASEYLLVPLAMIVFSTLSVFARRIWRIVRYQHSN